MLNLISVIIGLVALVCAAVGFIPFLGVLNYAVVALAIIGAGIGMLSQGNAGRNLNLFVILVAIVRLSLGGGIL